STAARAPLPSASMAITEATPMTTPSMVSAARNLLAETLRNAVRRRSVSDIGINLGQKAVAHGVDAAGITCHVHIMRHDYDRAALIIQFFQEVHDLGACVAIEVPR